MTLWKYTSGKGLNVWKHRIVFDPRSEIGDFAFIKTQQEEAFPTWIVVTIAMIVVVGAALLVYFAKVKKASEKTK